MKVSIRFVVVLSLLFSINALASPVPQPPEKTPPGKAKPKARTGRKETLDPASFKSPGRPGGAVPDTAGWGNIRLCNDADEDIEPAIIRAYRSNPQGNPIDTTMTAYMKRFANGKYRLNALFTDGDTYVPPPGPLPLPAPYTTSADPIVAANPYNDGTNPRTYYIVGTAQAYNPNGTALQNSIMLWWLRDGEISWNRVTLATNTDQFFFADKPWVTVSWYPPDRGWIWATYVRVPILGGSDSTIYIYRSIDGVNFGQMPATISAPGIHSPTILVDSNTGIVYLLYVSYNDNKIYITYTTNGGVSFVPAVGFDAGSATAPLLGPGTGDLIFDSSGVAVLARTLLHARYNSIDHSIGVVWHRREPNSQNTDVYFNSYSTQTQQWRGVKKVNAASSVNDQWNGALDFDLAGHYVVSWYDRRNDPNNRQYAIYATMLNAAGDRLDSTDTVISPTRPPYEYDPHVYEPYTGRNAILLGEYHDLWSWYDPVNFRMIWYSGDVGIAWPWTQGDIWEDMIQP